MRTQKHTSVIKQTTKITPSSWKPVVLLCDSAAARELLSGYFHVIVGYFFHAGAGFKRGLDYFSSGVIFLQVTRLGMPPQIRDKCD